MMQGPGSGLPFVGALIPSELHAGVSYRIEHVLGEGGTAVAYYAMRQSPEGESPVVIKIILPRIVVESGERALTIVKKEAVALGRLNERVPPTPFVVRLMDTGAIPFEIYSRTLRLPWIALEYVHGGAEGTTLEDRVDYSVRATGFAFDPMRAARAVRALSEGLGEIHDVGVVHRDLTPGNVLCCGAGDSELFKISDFGIARPQGLQATFGDAMVGTPGYVAPEQSGPGQGPIGPQSDIFSLAGIVYYLLTGQRYFDVRSPTQALVAASTPGRRSVLEAATLTRELREDEAACQAIDLALARATSPNPGDRPRSARLFAASLIPWLGEVDHGRPSARWVNSLEPLRTQDPMPGSMWAVRHPPGEDRLILSSAWNGAGHCLAVTTRGLSYWDGTRWSPAPTTGLPVADGLCFVRRQSPERWLIGSDGGVLAEYSREGVRIVHRADDDSMRYVAAHGDLSDMAVVVGEKPNSPPLLCGVVAGRWLKPRAVPEAATVSAVARIDDERWLVVGRTARGSLPPSDNRGSWPGAGSFAAIYRPLDWDLELLEVPAGRALLACASRPERRIAVAVGAEGAVVRVERERVTGYTIEHAPDLACIAIDVLGNEWAAGSGSVWSSRGRDRWKRVWENASWQAPFVSLLAETGMIVAMTVDGGVLECRSSVFDPTKPA